MLFYSKKKHVGLLYVILKQYPIIKLDQIQLIKWEFTVINFKLSI